MKLVLIYSEVNPFLWFCVEVERARRARRASSAAQRVPSHDLPSPSPAAPRAKFLSPGPMESSSMVWWTRGLQPQSHTSTPDQAGGAPWVGPCEAGRCRCSRRCGFISLQAAGSISTVMTSTPCFCTHPPVSGWLLECAICGSPFWTSRSVAEERAQSCFTW